MKILAIDTSTLVMSVSILEEEKVLGELITNNDKRHSVRLMPTISHLLTELTLTLKDIDILAVTKGPGSYTGIRIGVTTAKTFAWSNNLPLYGISILTVLAQNGLHFNGLVVPLIDARRNRVYAGCFQQIDGEYQEFQKQQVMPIASLLDFLADQDQSVLFLGDDCKKFLEEINQRLGKQAVFGTPADNIPKASQLGYLAWRKWRAKERPETDQFTPDYLQRTQAETNWLMQQKNGDQDARKL